MIRDPLQCRVGTDDVVRTVFIRRPFGDVRQKPSPVMKGAAGRFDHFRRAVKAAQHGLGPALGKHLRAVARPAAQIDNGRRGRNGDARGQVAARLCALFGKPQILIGVPTGHNSSPRPRF